MKDPTNYDCRVVVGYRIVNNGNKPPLQVPVYECPHKDKLAAGKCESNWSRGPETLARIYHEGFLDKRRSTK